MKEPLIGDGNDESIDLVEISIAEMVDVLHDGCIVHLRILMM